MIHKELSDLVLGGLFEVHNVVGPGLLESVYEKACEVEFVSRGLDVRRQVGYPVVYKGRKVGSYVADMVVEDAIILELKSVKCLADEMEAQLLNYLRISGLPVGYLVNFRNSRVGWRRMVR